MMMIMGRRRPGSESIMKVNVTLSVRLHTLKCGPGIGGVGRGGPGLRLRITEDSDAAAAEGGAQAACRGRPCHAGRLSLSVCEAA